MWRVTAAGQLDSSFGGGDGVASGRVGVEGNSAEDLALDSAGRIVFVVCAQQAEVPNSFAVGRLQPDGAPDPGFGVAGVVEVDLGDYAACPRAIATDGRDRILAAGSGSHDLLAARLRSGGALDRTFAGDGTARIGFRKSAARLGRAAIDGRDRVVLAGQIEPVFAVGYAAPSQPASGAARFALARYPTTSP